MNMIKDVPLADRLSSGRNEDGSGAPAAKVSRTVDKGSPEIRSVVCQIVEHPRLGFDLIRASSVSLTTTVETARPRALRWFI